MKDPACRLHVLLARQARVAVVLRRGPSRWVQLVRWSTDKDVFAPGQWFHGRIYERRCDLSPSGELLIYFAQKSNHRTLRPDNPYTFAWTAISRPPYLTALALWPKGDCWNGGGLFASEHHVLLNHMAGATPHPDHRPPGAMTITAGSFPRGEDFPTWWARAERDGWSRTQAGHFPHQEWKPSRPEIWQRPSPQGRETLVQTLHGFDFHAHGGPYRLSYQLTAPGGQTIALEGAEWADWDHRGRLVLARGGCLFRAAREGDTLREDLLTDLNPNQPAPLETPAWAAHW